MYRAEAATTPDCPGGDLRCQLCKSVLIRDSLRADFDDIKVQTEQENWQQALNMSEKDITELIKWGSTTVTDGHGTVLFIGGLIEMWKGRVQAWALLAPAVRLNMLRLTRMILRYLDSIQDTRVECTVSRDFMAGRRWARALNFTPEGVMSKYGPDGRDHVMYSRIKTDG